MLTMPTLLSPSLRLVFLDWPLPRTIADLPQELWFNGGHSDHDGHGA